MCNFPYTSPLVMRLFAAPSILRFFALAALAAPMIHAQPANDRIANAILIPSDKALQRVTGNIRGATRDTDVWIQSTDNVTNYNDRSVWYRWEAPISGKMQVQMRGEGFYIWGTTVRGTLDAQPLIAVGGTNGIWANFSQSWGEYGYDVEGGQTYYTKVEEWGVFSSFTSYNFLVAQLFQQDPLSDAFATRTRIAGRNFTVNGNNATYTAEDGEPLHGPSMMTPSGKSAWMTWRTTTRSTVTLSTESFAIDTVISVYTGDELTELTRIAQSSLAASLVIPGQPRVTRLTFVADPNVDYHFAVDGTRGNGGNFTFGLEATTARPGFLVRPTPTTVYVGDTATFSAVVSGTGEISYQWERYNTETKRWVPIENDSVFTGATTATLTITPTSIDMNGMRLRLATNDDVGPSHSAPVTLTVTELPAVQTEILGTVNQDITLGGNLTPPSNGGTYFVTGLPKGLTFNPETGVISGTVVGAKPGTYRVVYGSTDGKTRNPKQFVLQIIVAPFSTALLGTFEVLLDRPSDGLPAGKITLRTATNGNYTGSYFDLAQGRAYSFRGRLELNESARMAGTPIDVPVQISRGRGQAPLSLTFVLSEPMSSDPDTTTTLAAVLRDSVEALVAQGFDGARVASFKSANPAPWAGRYTVRLTDQIVVGPAPAAVPRGSGYATANINALGTLALRSRLADNTPVTANLASSPQGSYRAAQRVYGPGGSLAGRISLTEEITSDFTTRNYHVGAASGSRLYWQKPARPRDRLYPDGFSDASALGLSFRMQGWANASNAFISRLGLSETGEFKFNIASETVNNDALTTEFNAYNLPVTAFIAQNGKITYPEGNSTKFTISFNAATGEFKGSFRLTEPLAPGATKPIVRTVPFSGVLFQLADTFQGDVIGEGFFLLPPIAPDTLRTSGLIELRAGPPDSPFIVQPPSL